MVDLPTFRSLMFTQNLLLNSATHSLLPPEHNMVPIIISENCIKRSVFTTPTSLQIEPHQFQFQSSLFQFSTNYKYCLAIIIKVFQILQIMEDLQLNTNHHSLIISSRNLRAKIRSLLSTRTCQRYNHKSKRLMHILQKKQQQQDADIKTKNHIHTHFCTNRSPEATLQYENSSRLEFDNLFATLKHTELQKVYENKMYYLGQSHLDDFNKFLQQKQSFDKSKKQIKLRQNLTANIQCQKQKALPFICSHQTQHSFFRGLDSRSKTQRSKYRRDKEKKFSNWCKQKQRSDQMLRQNKSKAIQVKLAKAQQNIEQNKKKFSDRISQKHQRSKRAYQKVHEMQEQKKEENEFDRLASDLKRICGSRLRLKIR